MANPTTHDNSIDDNTNATSQKFTSNTKRKNKRNKQRYKNKSQHFNKPTESLQKSPESSIMADDDVTDHQVQQQTTDRDNSTNLNMTTVTTTTPPPPPPPPQHAQEANVYKSPRKEAIMRYKQNHDNTFNQLFDIKENLKSKENDDKQSQLQQATGGNQVNSNHNNGNHNISLDLDEKVTLFKYKSLKILELVNQNNANGSLLAHGIFEIFQLHQGDVTYLSCGNNFIYPLLPKIKVFRINSNQFLLPLVNPERYWKIFINSEELNVINNLINVFQRNVQFISLHESENISCNLSSQIVSTQNQRNWNLLQEIFIFLTKSLIPLHPLLYLQATFKLPSTYRHKGESPPTSIDNNKVRHFLILFHNHIFIKKSQCSR